MIACPYALPPVGDCNIPFPEGGHLVPIGKVIHHTESLGEWTVQGEGYIYWRIIYHTESLGEWTVQGEGYTGGSSITLRAWVSGQCRVRDILAGHPSH